MGMASIETAKETAAHIWNIRGSDVYASDVSAEYAWAREHAFVLVMDSLRRTMLVVLSRKGSRPIVSGTGVDGINALLHDEHISLPYGLSAVQLGQTVHSLLRGPGGFVGTSAFYKEQQNSLAMWISPSPKQGAEIFHRYCEDPQLRLQGQGWHLNFYFFNVQGGVELWELEGDETHIKQPKETQVVPNGAFLFPYG
jgi:hypothetical protein